MNDFGLLVSRYLATLPTLTDTELRELHVDVNGRLIISGRYLEDSAHVSGDAGLFIMGVRNDTDAVLTSADGDYTPFSMDSTGRLKVATVVTVEPSDAEFAEDSANTSGDTGLHVLTVRQDTLATSTSADGDYADFKVNALGELYVHDTDVKAQLVTANTTLSNIKTDTAAIVVSVASIDTKSSTIITNTGNTATSVASIDTNISSLTHAEDAPHVSGDKGILSLAVRNDADATLTSANGDYSPIAVDLAGRIKTLATINAPGAEQYSVTDALAAAGDGLETITASGTPWVTVASYTHTSGTAYLYGWQWGCDANGDARVVTDDTTDVIVYKRSVNSSATPSYSEHFSESGRIEIPGSALLEIKLQIKKRSAAGGNALGTGSLHLRVV